MDLELERRVAPSGASPFQMEGTVLTDCLYDDALVIIPDSCTKIDTAAFLNNLYVEEVRLSGSVSTIGAAAFSGCMYLSTVILSDGLKVIGEDAFLFSSLQHISLPESVTRIGCSAFQDTRLETIRIPGSIRVIPRDAFAFWNVLSWMRESPESKAEHFGIALSYMNSTVPAR